MEFLSCDGHGRVIAAITSDVVGWREYYAVWDGEPFLNERKPLVYSDFPEAYAELRRLVREHQRANQPKPRRVSPC